MDLKDYSTEELRAELKRRNDLAKAKKTKVKRCKMCKHWGEINYFGESPKNGELIMYEKNHSKINLQSNGGHRVDGSDFYLKKSFPK